MLHITLLMTLDGEREESKEEEEMEEEEEARGKDYTRSKISG